MDQLKDIMGEGFGEKLLDYMAELAKGLGVAAEHVYELFIKQQVAYGITMLVFGTVMLVLSIIFLWRTWKFYNKGELEYDNILFF